MLHMLAGYHWLWIDNQCVHFLYKLSKQIYQLRVLVIIQSISTTYRYVSQGIDLEIANIIRQLDFTVDQKFIRNIDEVSQFSVAVLSTLDCLACWLSKKVNCNSSSKHKIENIRAASAVSIIDTIDASVYDLGNAMCSTIMQMTLVQRDHLLQSKLIYRWSFVRPLSCGLLRKKCQGTSKTACFMDTSVRTEMTRWQDQWGSLYLFRPCHQCRNVSSQGSSKAGEVTSKKHKWIHMRYHHLVGTK